jgi:DNA-binding transcriptional LysR family regulator
MGWMLAMSRGKPMFPFTIRQIEVFLEICRARNFSSAAERLQVSQPTISNLIKSLETQLGVELFQRRRGASCVLTPEGLAFRDRAQHFMSQCEQLWRGVGRGARRPRPVRIFIGAHLLDDYIRPQLPQFHAEHPQLILNFLTHRSRDQLYQDIHAGKVDVAVVSSADDEDTPATLLLGRVIAGVYCLPEMAGTGTAAEIAGLPFVLPAIGNQLEAAVVRGLVRLGIGAPNVVASVEHHDVAVHMACEGVGALYSLQSIVDKHDAKQQLVRVLTDEPWQRRVYVDPRVEAPSATAIVNFLTRVLSVPDSGLKQGPREAAGASRIDDRVAVRAQAAR